MTVFLETYILCRDVFLCPGEVFDWCGKMGVEFWFYESLDGFNIIDIILLSGVILGGVQVQIRNSAAIYKLIIP